MGLLFVLLGVVGLTLLLFCYSSFSWGYVAYVLYGWFILPMFPEAPQISVLQFIGIALFLSALKPHIGSSIKSEYEDNTDKWTKFIITPWVLLFFAWFIHLFY